MLELRKFCLMPGSDNPDYLCAPVVDDHFVYASNGHVAVRVSREEYPGTYREGVLTALTKIFSRIEAEEYQPMPQILLKSSTCKQCGGLGLVQRCERCLGVGNVFCHACESDAPCRKCNGFGTLRITDEIAAVVGACSRCHGSGQRFGTDMAFWSTPLLNTHLSTWYLHLLMSLPGLQVAPNSSPSSPVRFRFDEGYAVAIPVRV